MEPTGWGGAPRSTPRPFTLGAGKARSRHGAEAAAAPEGAAAGALGEMSTSSKSTPPYIGRVTGARCKTSLAVRARCRRHCATSFKALAPENFPWRVASNCAQLR
jgi:hypothetical protein